MAERDIRYVLVIDTALNGCGVALYDGQKDCLVFDAFEPVARGQSERLLPMLEEQLAHASITYQDIDLVCGITGPGSFAGIRVGLSVVRSLALSLNIRAVGVSSVDAVMLQMMASSEREQIIAGHPLYVILESKRSDYYVERYVYDSSTFEMSSTISGCVEHEDLAARVAQEPDTPIMRGDGVGRFCEDNTAIFSRIDLLCVSRHVYSHSHRDDSGCVSAPTPTYFRGADVSRSKKKYRMVEMRS